jgi:hypothetical protein
MLRNLALDAKAERLFSYLGVLKHGNAYQLACKVASFEKA